jgi:uncharacterized protein (DUF58 family)
MIAVPATLVLAAAFAFAGAAFDSPSLYVPGIALALLVLGLRLWVGAAARRVSLEREPGPWTIVEGEAYPLAVTIRAGRVPLPGGKLTHPLADRPAQVPARSPIRAALEVGSLGRGRQDVDPVTLLLTDPLRLQSAEVRGGEPSQVLVLPRIEPVVVRGSDGGGGENGLLDGLEGLGATGLDMRPIDFEIDGLRPYRHGSPASRIHWPTVARSGEMVEHRLVAGADASPLVVLDSSHHARPEELDRAVRAAASLCVHLASLGGCGLLLAGDRAPKEIDAQLHTWPQAHARLAVIQPGGPPPSPRPTSRAELVFWVTAAAEAPGGRYGLRGRACFLVSPHPLPGADAAFTVAGCSGHRLGAARRLARSVEERAA